MAKTALRFGCAKQSKNLEWYLLNNTQRILLYVISLFGNLLSTAGFYELCLCVMFVVGATPTFVSFGEMFRKLSGSVVQGHKANSRAHKKLSSFFQLLAQYV